MKYTIYQKTIFTNRVIAPVCWLISAIGLKLTGWTVVGDLPAKGSKYVLIGAPHTSNWDFIIMLAAIFYKKETTYWMGKDSLFKGPLGVAAKWLGGIPIDRSKNNNTVDQMVGFFNGAQALNVVIPPEGTRGKTDRWKTGFYHIAAQADVPIILGFIDFSKKQTGFGPVFYPTGNLQEDIDSIKSFYRPEMAKYPDNFFK